MVIIRGCKTLYEENHKVNENGQLYKLCNCHEEYFPNEDGWFPCTEEYFYKNRGSSDGLFPYCKKCNIQKSIKWQGSNIENLKKSQRKYNRKETTKQIFRESNRKSESKGLRTKWRNNNKEKLKKYNKKYSNKKHTISKKEWEACKNYFSNSCAYCGMPIEEHRKLFNQDLHKEHIIDCGRSDLKNCVPSCKQCNSEKHNTSFNDWYNKNNIKYSKEKYLKIVQWIKYDCKTIINKINYNKNKLSKIS